MIKVMVVDDETDVQILFQQQFRRELKAGLIMFHFCFSGEEALKFLVEHDATDLVLILADINMPGMSGLELLKRIKEKYSTLKVFMIRYDITLQEHRGEIKVETEEGKFTEFVVRLPRRTRDQDR